MYLVQESEEVKKDLGKGKVGVDVDFVLSL